MAAIIKVQFPSDTSFAKLAELSRNPNAAVPDDAIPALDEQGDLMDATMRHRRVQEHAQSIYDVSPRELQRLIDELALSMVKIYLAPLKHDDPKEQGLEEHFSLVLRPSDIVIPICHQGFNRSQIMRIALLAFYRNHGWDYENQVLAPHGATSGCDPYTAYENLNEYNFFGYLHDSGTIFTEDYDVQRDTDPQSGPLHRSFLRTFGVCKCPRQGEEDAVQYPNLNNSEDIYLMERDRRQLRQRMSGIFSLLLQRASPEHRVVFLCFCRAFPVMLQRILELSSSVNKHLQNVVVIGLPYSDDTNTALRNIARNMVDQEQKLLDEEHVRSFSTYYRLFVSPDDGGSTKLATTTASSSSSSSSIDSVLAAATGEPASSILGVTTGVPLLVAVTADAPLVAPATPSDPLHAASTITAPADAPLVAPATPSDPLHAASTITAAAADATADDAATPATLLVPLSPAQRVDPVTPIGPLQAVDDDTPLVATTATTTTDAAITGPVIDMQHEPVD